MKLYKYTKFGIGKTVIETSKITLSKPAWFNDPFDCMPVIEEDELQRAIDVVSGYLLDVQVFQTLQELKEKLKKWGQRILVSFVLAEFHFAQKLAKIKPAPYRPVCNLAKINKLFQGFEKRGRLTAEQLVAKEKLVAVQEKIETFKWKTLEDMMGMRDRMYVACLSAAYDSILMWSYYAEDHQGVCFEIEIDDDSEYLAQVKYQTNRPTMQLEKLMRDFCGKMFAQINMGNVDKDPVLLPLVTQPFVTKAKAWEHEQEHRLIFLEEAFAKEGIEKRVCDDGKERYLYPVKITKVFCGANMSDDNKKTLRALVPSEIEVVEMRISDTKYELLC